MVPNFKYLKRHYETSVYANKHFSNIPFISIMIHLPVQRHGCSIQYIYQRKDIYVAYDIFTSTVTWLRHMINNAVYNTFTSAKTWLQHTIHLPAECNDIAAA